MARRYWAKVGQRKVYGESLDQVKAFAQQMANLLGHAIMTGWDEVTARKRPARRVMRRNPDPGSYLPVWEQQEKHRAARLDYNAATKGKRLAKSLRGRGEAAQAAQGSQKTAKFILTAQNRKEAFTLYRPSKRSAEALAGQFEAAGYHVSIRPA